MKSSHKKIGLFAFGLVFFIVLLLFALFYRNDDDQEQTLNASMILNQLNLDTVKESAIISFITEEDDSSIIIAQDQRYSTYYVLKAQCPTINDCELIWSDDVGYSKNEPELINWSYGNGNMPMKGLVIGFMQDEVNHIRLIGVPEPANITYHSIGGGQQKLFYSVFQEDIRPPVNIQGLSKSGEVLFESYRTAH